jgi:hypothetical protein
VSVPVSVSGKQSVSLYPLHSLPLSTRQVQLKRIDNEHEHD